MIITDDQGRAIAITTVHARRRAGPVPPGLISEVTLTIAASAARTLASHANLRNWISRALSPPGGETNPAPPGTANLAGLLARAIPAANLAAAAAAARAAANQAAGGCAHTRQSPGYRVPALLRRWLNTRDRTCRNPVCRQPATACDQDHTLAYHHGGRTSPCGLGALCRTHHKLKQLPGWHLSQDTQGTFTRRTPAGLTYRKQPHRYPI